MKKIKKMTQKLTAVGLSLIMVLVLVMSAIPIEAAAQSSDITTDFTDPYFLAVVRDLVGKSAGNIYLNDVKDLEFLFVDNANITSLDGIKHFTGLRYLYIVPWDPATGEHAVMGLNSLDLTYNVELVELVINNTMISALDVSVNTNLTFLNVSHNLMISPANIAGLGGLNLVMDDTFFFWPQRYAPVHNITATVNNPEWGRVSFEMFRWEDGVKAEVVAVPNRGFVFVNWNQSAGNISADYLSWQWLPVRNLTGPTTLQAVFRPMVNPRTVTVNVNNAGWGDYGIYPDLQEYGEWVSFWAWSQDGFEIERISFTPAGISAYWHHEDTGDFNTNRPRFPLFSIDGGFSMPNTDVVINVVFRQPSQQQRPPAPRWQPVPETQPFADAVHHWAGNSIAWAQANGITAGTSETTFHPERPVTRAEFLTFLYRIAGRPAVTAAENFSDVPVNHTFINAITWAYEAGLVTGAGGGGFAPERNITRAEMATMLRNYMRLIGKYQAAPDGALDEFPDRDQVTGWAASTVGWAAYNEILGRGGSLNAPGSATRAEAVAVLQRTVNTFNMPAPPR